MRRLLFVAALLAASLGSAEAQTLKFTAAQTVNANGTVTPALTWCTEGAPASSGPTCSGTSPAASCTASGDWTGTKGPAGSEALAAVSTSKSYVLQCAWPGQDQIKVTWKAPTLNDDGSPLTDLAGFNIYYGPAANSMTIVKDIANPAATSATVGPGLAPGTWFLAMDAYNTAKVLSKKTATLQKTLGTGVTVSQSVKVTFPNAPMGLTVE